MFYTLNTVTLAQHYIIHIIIFIYTQHAILMQIRLDPIIIEYYTHTLDRFLNTRPMQGIQARISAAHSMPPTVLCSRSNDQLHVDLYNVIE